MLRFPNATSDIQHILASLKFLMGSIDHNEYFDLFDMKEILVLNGFISSSGSTGMQALERSENVDRSKDRTYNQCKMYNELFRMLGFISIAGGKNEVHFSLLGTHFLSSIARHQMILSSCLLGIENPSEVAEKEWTSSLRPFLAILKCAEKLDGKITKDEIIYGPLMLKNDKDENEINSVCQQILSFRKKKGALVNHLKKILQNRRTTMNKNGEWKGKITPVTARNYTRVVISAIIWVDWFTKENEVFYLTKNGQSALKEAERKDDSRYKEMLGDTNLLTNISKYSYYRMMDEFGYDLGAEAREFEAVKQALPKHITDKGTLFSPFATVSNSQLSQIFGFTIPTNKRKASLDLIGAPSTSSESAQSLPLKLVQASSAKENKFSKKLKGLLKTHSHEEIATLIKQEVKEYKQEEFYPWIADVFSILGINCNLPQSGNHSVRWDALLTNNDGTDAIPIELKSPTEELHISTKAIRQALENKIILQSRRPIENARNTSTLAIGFELPNKRSEVDALIDAFEKTYAFKIAVIGADFLISLSIQCIKENKELSFAYFGNLRGVINE